MDFISYDAISPLARLGNVLNSLRNDSPGVDKIPYTRYFSSYETLRFARGLDVEEKHNHNLH